MSVTEEKFSEKFEAAAKSPKNRGAYYQEEAAEKGMALVEAKFKDTKLYWLVDIEEDRIYSAKFFAYGGKVSVAIGETLSSMVKGLTIDEACSLLGADVERALRDDPEVSAVPESKKLAFGNVPEMLKLIKENYPAAFAVAQAAAGINKEDGKAKGMKELTLQEQAWLGLSEEEQIQQINMVLDEKVRPALMNDGGNVTVMEVIDGEKVIIQYQGACGSCGSSLGATLSYIEQALRKDIYNDLQVTPNTIVPG
ncbi:MAG: iron-sulfur cluster assembly scaffold protein SufE [Nitrospinaceae bacterium]|nr:iron-sulfur cluster assembly scaffold protein SufE [Nitrospinaceae bacterium]NIR54043.1 iron-sulfur cluster assembly scaffold protein SufE [Nitrospinaceae bacterium]NIS84460.1 iron-sulfur cluster assembly scaffold protein SufE [Nitrospinaceae bacterium]NIT81256.1 iron-sulfur cluster assembly scaffold protein SufE [Nitrospinaceae bacterium]NIU43543.1 iron-sulfur cluster assembly scaffold protein SufE [Nitrospinaceae bacterium]